MTIIEGYMERPRNFCKRCGAVGMMKAREFDPGYGDLLIKWRCMNTDHGYSIIARPGEPCGWGWLE